MQCLVGSFLWALIQAGIKGTVPAQEDSHSKPGGWESTISAQLYSQRSGRLPFMDTPIGLKMITESSFHSSTPNTLFPERLNTCLSLEHKPCSKYSTCTCILFWFFVCLYFVLPPSSLDYYLNSGKVTCYAPSLSCFWNSIETVVRLSTAVCSIFFLKILLYIFIFSYLRFPNFKYKGVLRH